MNEGELVWVEALGEAVPRETLVQHPELLDHEQVIQRRHEEWLAEARRRRERERAELEAEREKLELESEAEREEIEDGARLASIRRPRREAGDTRPPDFSTTRSEAERGAFHGGMSPCPSEATQGTPQSVRMPPAAGNARYCRECRAQIPEKKRRRGSVQEFCTPKHKAAWHRKKKARTATTAGVDVIAALSDAKLLGAALGELETWRVWFVFLKALFCLELDAEELDVYQRHTGRSVAPTEQAREAWVVAGRRGGKSRMAALVAVFLACFRDYTDVLAKGERGTLMVIAADRKQARTVFRYIEASLDGSPMLARMVASRSKESIDLTNRITIEVHTASFRAVRGYTLVGAVVDEIAYWPSDESSANPDVEIVNALRPGMATVPGAMLLAISSPYARKGGLWNAFEQHYGKDGDPVLVWKATSLEMNPSLPVHVVESAYASDEASASAEYGAEFRRDVETYISREVVADCTIAGRHELPPASGVRYFGFVDPSAGSSDSFTLAIAHEERGVRVLDAIRERHPPFSPDAVVKEFAELLKTYRVTRIQSDRWGGAWVTEVFAKAGITCEQSAKPKSELYAELLPLLNSGGVELLDVKRLRAQLVGLERRTARGGRDSIDHAPRGHDDVVNAAAGAFVLLKDSKPAFFGCGGG